MPLVSALVLPHGTMPFDGDPSLCFSDETTAAALRVKTIPPELKKDCSAIFTLTNDAVQSILNTRPDVIFLNTPHGICLSDSMGVYTNPKARGNAEWNGQWDEYSIEVDLDMTLSEGLIHHLRGAGIPTEGITCFSRYDSPLRWGEVVPLWYLKPLLQTGTKLVITSNPTRLKSAKGVEEIGHIGKSLGAYINSLEQRVLYVCSGDLAHTHRHDCHIELYLPSPKWPTSPPSITALPFDVSIANWIQAVPYSDVGNTGPLKTVKPSSGVWDAVTLKQAKQWLDRAFLLKTTALSCGFNGFCLLQGMLEADISCQTVGGSRTSFSTTLFCRLAPTYYGMMSASFIKQETN